ncbi:MAG: benzoyl-CoA 2,3-epoxidase subunit BoxB [Planctomycetota bacterium]
MSYTDELIPNNVNLSSNPKLQKALEAWHPKFMQWWMEMGPAEFQDKDIYLRTAVSVDAGGWAQYGYVKMPEYRWGIFLNPKIERKIHFGDRIGEGTWDDVPGEFRKELRRLIVTQADTEPGSVEQQRMLGHCAPSLYDMRNLFQVNVEEARHLWAMVYVLHQHFGKDGREEAEDLLIRRSGHPDTPRILNTFNEPITDWLDFFCFTMFTDRDGKYQLGALAESCFDPLARTCQFMLTEEAHHLFVGETGVGRILRRTAQLAKQGDVRKQGGIPFDIIQKYINHWFSSSIELFGSEDSSNAATYFAAGLKGRFDEGKDELYPDHRAADGSYTYETVDENGRLTNVTIPMRRGMNAILKDSYAADCEKSVGRWNKILEEEGCEVRVSLPSIRFNRIAGVYKGLHFDPKGNRLSATDWEVNMGQWLPTRADREYVRSLMKQVTEPGKFANYISAPKVGINRQPVEFEYVRL